MVLDKTFTEADAPHTNSTRVVPEPSDIEGMLAIQFDDVWHHLRTTHSRKDM